MTLQGASMSNMAETELFCSSTDIFSAQHACFPEKSKVLNLLSLLHSVIEDKMVRIEKNSNTCR